MEVSEIQMIGINEEGYRPTKHEGKGEILVKERTRVSPTVKVKGKVYVSTGTVINEYTELFGGIITIGKYCSIARNVVIQNVYHGVNKACSENMFYYRHFTDLDIDWETEPNIIGNDVWIGTRAIILKGVNIGDGAVIGAGAVVTDDVEPYSIVVGIPAKHLKWRFNEDVRKFLQDVKWWDWSDEKIQKNREFFTTDLTKINDIKEIRINE